MVNFGNEKDSRFFYFAIFFLQVSYALRDYFIPNIAAKRKKSWKLRFQNHDGEMVKKEKDSIKVLREILNKRILIR